MTQSLANIGIAITRPSDQAKKLSQLIADDGGTPILFPLIAITPLVDYSLFESVIAKIYEYDWAIFISSNAVQNGMPKLVNHGIPAHLKFAAIGPVTASELNAYGVKKVLIPYSNREDNNKESVRYDSESLLALPEMQAVQGKRVMIIRGIGGRELLADTLKARGATVTFAECYQRINPQQNIDALSQAYTNNNLQAIVVTSSEAMRNLLDLAHASDWLKQVTLFVNHTRIGELPLEMGFNVVAAKAPGDAAMMNCLRENLGKPK